MPRVTREWKPEAEPDNPPENRLYSFQEIIDMLGELSKWISFTQHRESNAASVKDWIEHREAETNRPVGRPISNP
jgi:hypothetical protein